MMGGSADLLRALCLALCLALPGAVAAQTTPATPPVATEERAAETDEGAAAEGGGAADQVPTAPVADAAPTPPAKTGGLSKSQTAGSNNRGGKSISVLPSDSNALDYAAWERLATRAETALADSTTSNNGLELLRGQLVDWRTKLQGAQNTNATRIATSRTQITALGPAPADGESEAPEIAERRKALNEQLARLQAPGLAAEEAYRRASGLVSEIDRVLRERQANELLKLWPNPLNPANWGTAAAAVRDSLMPIWAEAAVNWTRPDRRAYLVDNLPVIGVLLLLAIALIWRGRAWIEGFALRLQTSAASARGRRLWGFLASLGQIIVPTVGVFLISVALALTEMAGSSGKQLIALLPPAGFALFAAHWLGGRIFPKANCEDGPLSLGPEQCAEGRFHATMIGLVLALETLRAGLLPNARLPEAAVPVITLPLILLMGLMLWRIGHLLNRHLARNATDGEAGGFANRIIGILAKVTIAIAVAGPLLALIGYASAAAALVFPAAGSLGLLALLVVILQLIGELYSLILRLPPEDDAQSQGLLPVLVGFLLTLASLPLFALIWGARFDDLTELWARFTQGFQIGETRISPSNFLYFAVLFAIGLALTRLFQGALKSSILPKTKLDQGGRNAIVSGTGYLGIFLAGLIAINSAGIDLSGLAIVAGALSLGIGFGLQNIVQNFVSGIILLIERPVSEGDWIEVGTVSGTVKAISVRSTRIQTFDRSDVIVPNADLVSQRVTNWTRYNLSGRLIVPVMVIHGSDPDQVLRVLREIAEAQPMAVLNPPPVVALVGFALDGIQFEIRVILRDVNFQLSVRSAINQDILRRFRDEGIALAHTGAGSKPLPEPEPEEDEASAPHFFPAVIVSMPASADAAKAAQAAASAVARRSERPVRSGLASTSRDVDESDAFLDGIEDETER